MMSLCDQPSHQVTADIRRQFGEQLKQPPQGLEAAQQAPRRLSGGGLDQYVDRVTGDSECRAGSLRDEHERERVKRLGPFDQLRVLETEGMLLRDEYVADGEVVAAGAAQPGRVPRAQDLALR